MSVHQLPAIPEPLSLDDFLRITIRQAVADEFAVLSLPQPTLTVDVPQAAALLCTSTDTVRRLIHEGALPTVDMGTNRQIIPRRALEAYVNGSPPA